MELKDVRIGFAMCGSFCTFKKVISELDKLCESGADVYPIMSDNAYSLDTRFGAAADFRAHIEEKCHRQIIGTIKSAEPIGPKGLLDILVIAPCTGNTLAKLAAGIADTSVTLAAKAHLRNERPIVVAVSTNDGLAAAAKNIGALLNRKNIYFVPFGQDDYINKPCSLVADMPQLEKTIICALDGKQLQPVLCC